MNWVSVAENEEYYVDKEKNLRKNMTEQLPFLRNLPSGPTYAAMCRLLAKLCLESNDELEGISHLIESHGISLRLKLLMKYHRMRRISETSLMIDKKFIEYNGDYSNDNQSFLKRLEELPQEWTVVQISCAHHSRAYFGGPKEQLTVTPDLHVTRMGCGPLAGQPGHLPICVTVRPPPHCRDGSYVPLRELAQILEDNKTDGLLGNGQLYRKTRMKVDIRIQTLVNFMGNSWLQGWKCLLPGRLVDRDLQARLETCVDQLLENEADVDSTTEFSLRGRQILYCAAQNLHHLSDDQIIRVVAASIGEDRLSPRTHRLATGMSSLAAEFKAFKTARRHPVVLIIDEKLDGIPWEMVSILSDQPVTRIPSLHILHGLYKAHERTVVNGLKVVYPSEGYYIVNPNMNLPNLETCMRNFLLPRMPNWPGVIGSKPTSEDFERALHDSSVFVYMGHGSGSQFINLNSLNRGISSTALLFGCNSARLNMLGGQMESDGRALVYPSAASPCMVGMLWDVTDRDTDALAQRILDMWLPKKEEDEETVAEPELLRAIQRGRQGTRFYINSAAVVARGLPVQAQLLS